MCAAGLGNCDNNAANGCETTLANTLAHCGACGTSCGAGRCDAGRCVSNRNCAEILRTAPTSSSGNYTIDPDGAGGRSPYTVYRDMPQLDEKLYLEVFASPETAAPRRASARR